MIRDMHPSVTTLYGIRNCDTVKRARAWLDAHQAAHVFHDFKLHGVPSAALDEWLTAVGWETLVNRQGTTWRRLDDATRAAVTDSASACALMLATPSVIKRPVMVWSAGHAGGITVGFKPQDWSTRLSQPGARAVP
jgi:Spx/MgsR family transcriptional regulator